MLNRGQTHRVQNGSQGINQGEYMDVILPHMAGRWVRPLHGWPEKWSCLPKAETQRRWKCVRFPGSLLYRSDEAKPHRWPKGKLRDGKRTIKWFTLLQGILMTVRLVLADHMIHNEVLLHVFTDRMSSSRCKYVSSGMEQQTSSQSGDIWTHSMPLL